MPDALDYQRREPGTTVLYRIVPRFVERELRTYLTCGILAHGFLRVRCDNCGRERLVPFLCKTRSLCPSCGARRMSDTAAHLVDRVLPEVPVRQYVLSLPFALRTGLAFDQRLCGEVLRIFIRSVFASLRRLARETLTETSLHCGSVCFLQRSGGAINLNPHYHVLVLDGVYVSTLPYEPPRFTPLPPPSREEVTRITASIARRLERLLVKKDLLGEHAATHPDPLQTEESLLPQLYATSVRGRIATGPHAGQRLLLLGDRIDVDRVEAISGPRCASVQGFSLQADVGVPARDRRRLERLARCCARPPIASNRLSEAPDGRIVYRLRNRWRDGTTHVVFDPLDLVARLAALVPPPRANLVRYFGILAPCASWRDAVVRDRDELSLLAQPPLSCPCKPSPAPGRAPARPASTEDDKDSPPASRPTPPPSERGVREAAAPSGEVPAPSGPASLRPRRLSWHSCCAACSQ